MKSYKRTALILTLGIMLIGLITFRLVPSDSTEPSDAQPSTGTVQASTVTVTPTPDATPSPLPDTMATVSTPNPTQPPVVETNELLHEAYPEIHTLVEKYLNAKLECRLEAFEGIVTDTQYINLADVAQTTQSIKSFGDIDCYTKKGVGEIDLVVYFTYTMSIVQIDTPVPSIDSLCIKFDENGAPKVFGGEIASETLAALDEMNTDADVLQLIADTSDRIHVLLETDEDLREFWDNLLNKVGEGEDF